MHFHLNSPNIFIHDTFFIQTPVSSKHRSKPWFLPNTGFFLFSIVFLVRSPGPLFSQTLFPSDPPPLNPLRWIPLHRTAQNVALNHGGLEAAWFTQNDPRETQTHTVVVHGGNPRPQFHEETDQERKKKKVGREREKRERNFGPLLPPTFPPPLPSSLPFALRGRDF